MRISAAGRVARWNEKLLDHLLPLVQEPRDAVLLGCDDEALRAVAAQLELDPATAADTLAEDVRIHFGIGQIAGFNGVRSSTISFGQAVGLRETPPFFSLLCLCVLAASRMAPDESHSTSAYYVHLRELLGLSRRGDLPNMDALPPAFDLLAETLLRARTADENATTGWGRLAELPPLRASSSLGSLVCFDRSSPPSLGCS